jgi:hypothetical protein
MKHWNMLWWSMISKHKPADDMKSKLRLNQNRPAEYGLRICRKLEKPRGRSSKQNMYSFKDTENPIQKNTEDLTKPLHAESPLMWITGKNSFGKLIHFSSYCRTRPKDYQRSKKFRSPDTCIFIIIIILINQLINYISSVTCNSTSFANVKPWVLDSIFATFGKVHTVKMDNGPPFHGHQFREYAEKKEFYYHRITPRRPQANGEYERFMESLNKAIRI